MQNIILKLAKWLIQFVPSHHIARMAADGKRQQNNPARSRMKMEYPVELAQVSG